MLPLALSVSAEDVAESPSYRYSEGWEVVSAPPPPGPYMAVNLDPRIPGLNILPLLPVSEPASANTSEMPADDIPVEALENPPAAGVPVLTESVQGPAAELNAVGATLPASGPRHDARMRPAYNYPAAPYPAAPRYPARTGFPNYRNTAPMGYYGAAVPRAPQQGRQVPPPPVYDAMMNERGSYTNPGWGGAP